MTTKTIKVNYLARVEGEGALYVKIRNKTVADVKLKIFEPPRFFEAFLRGRMYHEVVDITSRICGICPVAYQMSAVHAIENIIGAAVPDSMRDLRRLLYCGEWIESHTLHIYMLHAPDFLGFPDAVTMAKVHPEAVKRGLTLKKAGNTLVSVIGGREVHPINVRVGGFYKLPRLDELRSLLPMLQEARDLAEATAHWVATFPFPDYEQDYELVALHHDAEYPMNEGRIRSNKGLDIMPSAYDEHFEEQHVPYTNALQSIIKTRGAYLTGPMARFHLNRDRLSNRAKALAKALEPSSFNPFQSIIIRSIEVLYACEEAIRLIERYREPAAAKIELQMRAGIGFSCTEAPRGTLYHRYQVDAGGLITDAKIVPPTSQNQKSIEDDLRKLLPDHLDKSSADLTHLCEQAIRNYDPCISCATHFLKIQFHDETSETP